MHTTFLPLHPQFAQPLETLGMFTPPPQQPTFPYKSKCFSFDVPDAGDRCIAKRRKMLEAHAIRPPWTCCFRPLPLRSCNLFAPLDHIVLFFLNTTRAKGLPLVRKSVQKRETTIAMWLCRAHVVPPLCLCCAYLCVPWTFAPISAQISTCFDTLFQRQINFVCVTWHHIAHVAGALYKNMMLVHND